MKKKILQLCVLTLVALTIISFKSYSQYWKLKGNAGTDPNINFVGTTDLQPLLFKTNAAERMRILSNGKVGIGVKAPTAKLHVDGNDNVTLSSPGYLMLGKTNTYNIAMDDDVIQARNNGAASGLYLNYYGGTTYFGQNGHVAVTAAGNITTTGIVGIAGTTNASYGLNVNASSSLGGIVVTDPVDNYALFCAKSGLDAGVYVSKASTTTSTPCIQGSGTGSAGGVEGNSNTGIGVYGSSTSSYGLYGYSSSNDGLYATSNAAVGSGYAGYFVGNNWRGIYVKSATNYIAGYFDGDVYTTGIYSPFSNVTLNKNFDELSNAMSNAMSIINKLQPKSYEFRNDGNFSQMNLPKGKHFGLIAEDVEKVLPGLVKAMDFETKNEQPKEISKDGKEIAQTKSEAKSEKIDFKAVNYTELIPIIVKGMQEQQAVINQQQQQIDELKQLVKQMAASNTSDAKAAGTATGAYLIQNAPNPFSENTKINCYVPSSVKQAQLAIYNMKGQLIKSYKLSAGINNLNITGGTLASGQYTYSLLADGKKVDTKTMIMIN